MKKLKVLNLYAGLSGNRKYWKDVDVTSIELDSKIASTNKKMFPDDTVITEDAKEYLLNNYSNFDFVWASPTCQENTRFILSGRNRTPKYPNLDVYELKIFLDTYFNGYYCIENVIPYYKPLIDPSIKIGRHLFWSNFTIDEFVHENTKGFITKGTVKESENMKKWLGLEYEGNIYYKGNHDPCQVLRNAVHPEIGLHIFNCLIRNF